MADIHAATAANRTRGHGEIVDVAGKATELALRPDPTEAGRPEIVGLTADMGRYSDILPFRDAHPGRFFRRHGRAEPGS